MFSNYNLFLFLSLFSLSSCDYREIVLEVDLTSEAPKLVVDAILLNDDYASVKIQRTIPVNSDSFINSSIKSAEILLWENDILLASLVLKTDTIWSNKIDPFTGEVENIATGILYDYGSSQKLQLETEASYHLSITAEGYPDAVSEKVIYTETTSILDYIVSGPERDELNSLVFPEVSINIKNTSESNQIIDAVFYPWRHDIEDLTISKSQLISASGEIRYNFDGSIEDNITIRGSDIAVRDFFATNETNCVNRCLFSPEGSMVIVKTFSPELAKYRDFLATNSNEYIGGFFPRNPYLKTNINGGYGFFAVVEQDTFIIEE